MSRSRFKAAAVAGLAALLCSTAHASLMGKTLQMQWYSPDASTPLDTPFNGDVLVTDNLEIEYAEPRRGNGFLQIDLRDQLFVVHVGGFDLPSEGFFGFALRDVADEIAPITSLLRLREKPGKDGSIREAVPWLTFDADTMWFNFAAIPDLPSSRDDPMWSRIFAAEVTFATTQQVPEPSTCALMAGGLGVLAWRTRRRAVRPSA